MLDSLLGCFEGARKGICDGMSVGCLVGLDDRNIRGFKLGADIGNAVGNICGCCVGRRFKGRTVGRDEGCLVGHAKGCLEGKDGRCLGWWNCWKGRRF